MLRTTPGVERVVVCGVVRTNGTLDALSGVVELSQSLGVFLGARVLLVGDGVESETAAVALVVVREAAVDDGLVVAL
jgi:hypothetical protein